MVFSKVREKAKIWKELKSFSLLQSSNLDLILMYCQLQSRKRTLVTGVIRTLRIRKIVWISLKTWFISARNDLEDQENLESLDDCMWGSVSIRKMLKTIVIINVLKKIFRQINNYCFNSGFVKLEGQGSKILKTIWKNKTWRTFLLVQRSEILIDWLKKVLSLIITYQMMNLKFEILMSIRTLKLLIKREIFFFNPCWKVQKYLKSLRFLNLEVTD